MASGVALAQSPPAPTKPATAATRAANQKLLQQLPFADRRDFDDATRGLVDRPATLTIRDPNGKIVWNLEPYRQFITPDAPAPDTVNPSLWRNAQLNLQYGLFRVTDDIYQVRGYDLANISFIRGKTGWIVFDPLQSAETAKAAYDLVTKNLGKLPVVAVVYSHSHVDHYGGVRGIVDEADVKAGKVKIFAPEGFLEHAISENVIAGNAMSRRAVFMYGTLLPRNAQGGVNAGLGQTTSQGTVTLIPPTDTIAKSGETVTVDGVTMVFQLTPGTEAPAEMNTWFPQWNALWMAENTTNTMHNILTLRGAQVRDAQRWASYLDETIGLWGDKATVKFQSHHWPKWGNAEVLDYLRKQRDVYKYLHDQSVNLMNHGETGPEIAEEIALPPELENNWPTRGYYGTLRHNSRAVYQRYMGWYDGNPANLNPLTPVEVAKKYVEYMGGSGAMVSRARKDFDAGNYRWVAEAMKQAVFAEPDNTQAKALLADAFEQMGYQAESGPWRSVYLQGAFELRNGVPNFKTAGAASADVIRAMPPEMLFDYLSVRLNGPRAAGKKLALNFDFSDLGKVYGVRVENGVMNHGGAVQRPDATLKLPKATLDTIQLGQTTMEKAIASGDASISGDPAALKQFMSLLDSFPFWFNIVTP
ncbi:alkyl/aryl-sulfatase [Sandaracinobacteroides hominis]|uniref:alkyl/aryl-sulfatase n=1 Tax=Sandaracinobacteroides hominis TaxID=2780086 RepID=UPI0018F6E0E0|nr:alkyl sulfatase dimerization domain-containing protein [Sandaracinobacteroides hominis]